MKHLLIISLLCLLSGCTENQRARSFGGTENIYLPKGYKLVTATWKQDNLWYLTEPMTDDYKPQTRTFREKSSFGTFEGTVIFYESK